MWRQWRRSSVYIVNFKYISHLILQLIYITTYIFYNLLHIFYNFEQVITGWD